MISSFYFLKIPRRLRILIIFLLIILIAYLIFYFLTPDAKNIPEDFLKARQEASLIAKEIVADSNEIVIDLNKISLLDQEKKYEEALDLISQELLQIPQTRGKAIKLAAQLELMAKNINNILPASAAQTALQAVSSETALISRLIAYNELLVKLLENLRGKFIDKKNNNGQIAELINQINEEVKIINELDKNFNELMGEFDKINK